MVETVIVVTHRDSGHVVVFANVHALLTEIDCEHIELGKLAREGAVSGSTSNFRFKLCRVRS